MVENTMLPNSGLSTYTKEVIKNEDGSEDIHIYSKGLIIKKVDIDPHKHKQNCAKNTELTEMMGKEFEAWKRESLKKKNKKTFQFLKKLGYKILVINNNCIAFSKEDYRINFIKVFIKILRERDEFNPNQGFIYNLRQTYSSLKKYLIRVIK